MLIDAHEREALRHLRSLLAKNQDKAVCEHGRVLARQGISPVSAGSITSSLNCCSSCIFMRLISEKERAGCTGSRMTAIARLEGTAVCLSSRTSRHLHVAR